MNTEKDLMIESQNSLRLRMGLLPILGVLLLMWSASVYTGFGFGAYPRQEWLIEALFGILFILPVVKILRNGGASENLVRMIGLMLLFHSGWDALHWPTHALVSTPIDPSIPRICPFLDIPLGFLLVLRGR